MGSARFSVSNPCSRSVATNIPKPNMPGPMTPKTDQFDEHDFRDRGIALAHAAGQKHSEQHVKHDRKQQKRNRECRSPQRAQAFELYFGEHKRAATSRSTFLSRSRDAAAWRIGKERLVALMTHLLIFARLIWFAGKFSKCFGQPGAADFKILQSPQSMQPAV